MIPKQIQKILNIIEQSNHEAFLVGGFVRDTILGIPTQDVDICTNATPTELTKIFPNLDTTHQKYGQVQITMEPYTIEITTYRQETHYQSHRYPTQITFVSTLKEDLPRRDFTINTLCMNKEGQIIDLNNARQDLANQIIKTVGNPEQKLQDDSLRILRAIRFATILDFSIDLATEQAIITNAHLLSKLSFHRKKAELDKIFSSPNKEKGLYLLQKYHLDKYLEINLKNIIPTTNYLGIWLQFNHIENIYPFTRQEKSLLNKLKELQQQDIFKNQTLYKYGLENSLIVAEIKKIDLQKINQKYQELPIKSSKDLAITVSELLTIIKDPTQITKTIQELEDQILSLNLPNDHQKLQNYLHQKLLK